MGRTSSRVHREDFLQSTPGGLPPESTESSFKVCSFGGQVHTVCCAWPGTFSVTVTFTTWWTRSAQPQRISSIQMKWENFRKERAQSSLLFMQITLPTLGVNSPHIHSPIRQRITECQQVKSKLRQLFFYLLGEYLFSLNPQSNIRQLGCEWNNDRTNRKSRSFLSVTMPVVDGRCFGLFSVAAVNYPDTKQSRGEWVYSADNSRPLPTIVGKSNQEHQTSNRIASIVKNNEWIQALCSARLSYKG